MVVVHTRPKGLFYNQSVNAPLANPDIKMPKKITKNVQKNLALQVVALKKRVIAERNKANNPPRGAYPVYTGHGKYKSKIGKAVGRFAGGIASHAGKELVSKGVAALMGSGSYTSADGVHTNALVEGIASGSHSVSARYTAPNDETGSIVITRKEYIGDVLGPVSSFSNQTYSLNPGLSATTDWLSQLAANYEQYEYIQLIVEYRSTTTDIGSSTTGQCGTVIMATNYNSAAEKFTDKISMMEYHGAHSCKTTEHMLHGVECDRKKVALSSILYTRTGPVPSTQDVKTYDHGLLQVAVANSPAGFQNLPIGELWMYYMVKLSVPKLTSARGLTIPRDLFTSPYNGVVTGTGANPFGGAGGTFFRGGSNSIGVLFEPDGTGATITFPAWYAGATSLLVNSVARAVVAGAALDVGITTLTGNITAIMDMNGSVAPANSLSGGAQAIGSAIGSDVSVLVHVYIAPATSGVNNKMRITGGVGCTSLVSCYADISQYNSFGVFGNSGKPVYLDSFGNPVATY